MNQKRIRGILSVGLLVVIGLLVGCVFDDSEECTSNQSEIYIIVKSPLGEDAYVSVNGAVVYLFGQDERYIGSVQVLESQIKNLGVIDIPVALEQDPWAVVWGNTGGRMPTPTPQPGDTMEEVILSLQEDEEGFAIPADDLYYGIAQLSSSLNKIVISPITTRVIITVKGLSNTDESTDYYFTIDTQYGGYDFLGNPIAKEMRIKLPGEFNQRKDLITLEPYHIIHYPDNPFSDDASITIGLWEVITGGQEPRLLISGDRDVRGMRFFPISGKTMHILIIYTDSGVPHVDVVVTDWDEIHQWI